jgi:hypothetical protein
VCSSDLDKIDIDKMNLPASVLARYAKMESANEKADSPADKSVKSISPPTEIKPKPTRPDETPDNKNSDSTASLFKKESESMKESLSKPLSTQVNLPKMIVEGLMKALKNQDMERMLAIISAYSVKANGLDKQLLEILQALCSTVKEAKELNTKDSNSGKLGDELLTMEVILKNLKLSENIVDLPKKQMNRNQDS